MLQDKLIPGKYITIIQISDYLAHTLQQVYKIIDDKVWAPVGDNGRTSTKRFSVRLDKLDLKETLIFITEKPIQWGADSQFKKTGFHGNAMINLGGLPAGSIKALLPGLNQNEYFMAWSKILYWSNEEGESEYPELFTEDEVAELLKTSLSGL